MTKQRGWMGFLVLALALTACSGGGSSGGGTAGLQWQGVALDGYLQGAKVCLDLNDNQACDLDEPKDTTGVNGVYSLALGNLEPAKLVKMHLIVDVPDTARDSDDHGRMLKDVGKPGYVMMSPVAGFISDDGRTLRSAVISPFTTLISYEMLKNPSKDDVKLIENTVKQYIARTDATLMDDYLARMTPDHNLHLQARAIATAAAHGRKVLKLSGSEDREALLGAYAYVRKNASLLVNKTPQQIENEVDSRKIELTDEAKLYTQSVQQDVAALLNEGLYAPVCFTPCASGAPDGYQKNSTSQGRWAVLAYRLDTSAWQLAPVPDDGARFLSASGWNAIDLSGTVTADKAGQVTWTRAGRALKVSARAYDLGKLDDSTIAKIPNMDDAAKNALKNYFGTTFPAGSKNMVLEATTLEDSYAFNLQQAGTLTGIQGMSRLQELEAKYATGQAGASNQYLMTGLHTFTFNGDGTLTLWSEPAFAACLRDCRSRVGTGTYAISTVHQQRVLTTNLQLASGRLMFAEYNGQLVAGEFSPKGSSQVLSAGYNKVAMNGLLKSYQKPPVLD